MSGSLAERSGVEVAAALERANRRFPYPLVDDVCIGEFGRGRKYVSSGEVYVTGHFPEEPVLPGVLIIGALTSVAAVMLDHGTGGPAVRRIRRFRFHLPVRAGDVLELCVRALNEEDDGRWFEGEAVVDGRLVARGRFCF